MTTKKWYSNREVQKLTGKSRPTIDRWEAEGKMPRGLRPSKRTVVWPTEIIDQWLAGQWTPASQEVSHA